MNSTLTNYTDVMLTDSVTEPSITEVRWSQLAQLKYSKVPECIKVFMKEKADYYKDKPWAYTDKDYSSPKSTQIEINSKSDEATMLEMLNNPHSSLRVGLSNLIIEAAAEGLVCRNRYNYPLLQLSHYKFNGDNQDIPVHQAGTFDLVRDDTNYNAFYSIEVKTSIFDSQPTELHKAELVLLHVLGKDQVVVFLATAPWESRTNSTYVRLGCISGVTGWKNVRVDSQWNITKW